MIRTTVSLLVLAASSAASLPAAADPRATAPAAPAPAPAPVETPKAKRYCIVESFTGSRMPQKVCHTRDEWRERGVDINAAK